ncbi:MAG: isocitrate lyase/phosphoenolpyruvate mutase family protein [Pseudomonadota bacterium]
MTPIDNFEALHERGSPLILFNIWDAGSALAVARAGAKAIATGSASLAGAQGFEDGEGIPFEALLVTVRQIKAACPDLPLTVDFETGFASDLAALEANARALIDAGAVGCNFEDRWLDREGLRAIDDQADRIGTLARAGLFVNARTDLFLAAMPAGEDPNRADLVEGALERAAAYQAAGARSFFVPGLSDPDLIARMCEGAGLPLNVMRLSGMVDNAELAKLGVARISYGPGPWNEAMSAVERAAEAALMT